MDKEIDLWEEIPRWEQKDHPHRKVIIELMKEVNPQSILEVGCGHGVNLYNIKKAFPDAVVKGIDIDKWRMKEGMVKLKEAGIDVKMSYGDIVTIDLPPKSYDIVLTDATLLMIDIDPEKIKDIIKKIINTAKKMVILVEFHSAEVGSRGRVVENRVIRNYVKILNDLGIKDIRLRKITKKEYPSEKWHQDGYYISIPLC